MELCAPFLKGFAIELFVVVDDKRMGGPIVTHNQLPQEILDVHGRDGC